jgi:hypothetical protein
MHRKLHLPQIPPLKCATPTLGRVGRGGHASFAHPPPVMTNQEGYDHYVPKSLQNLFNVWEEELTDTLPSTQRTLRHRNNYWVVKNLTTHTLLSLLDVFIPIPPNSPCSLHSPNTIPPPLEAHPNNLAPLENKGKIMVEEGNPMTKEGSDTLRQRKVVDHLGK